MTEPSTRRTVLFDLDGVLVTTESMKATAHAETVQRLGGNISRDFYAQVMGGSHEWVRAAFIRQGGLTAAPEEYSQLYREIYEGMLRRDVPVTAGIRELLAALGERGYALGLVTSSRRWMVDQIFRQTQIEEYFDAVITADDVERHKPAPDPYLAALEQLEADAPAAVVLEDSEVGIEAARSAGIPVIAFRHGFNDGHDFRAAAKTIRSFENTAMVIDCINEVAGSNGSGLQTSAGTVLERVRDFLKHHEIPYRELHHEPTLTSEDSARVRGEDIRIGGKALLLKVGEDFRLFVLSAALRVDSQAVRSHFGVRKTRFASAAELKELTGLAPGSVPPFGRPILPFDLYVDPSLLENERIAFNAGSLTDSVFLRVADYVKVAKPTVFPFAAR